MLARTHTLHLPPISYPSGKGWYVVHANIKCVDRARKGLKAKDGLEPYVPMSQHTGSRSRNHAAITYEYEKALFDRYFFVSCDPNEPGVWDKIKSTDGVEYILTWPKVTEHRGIIAKVPLRVPLKEIERIMGAEAAGAFDYRIKPPAELVPGDRVRLADKNDPRSAFIAEIILAKPNGKVEALFKMLGSAIKGEMYVRELEKL